MLLLEISGKVSDIETVEKTDKTYKLRFEIDNKLYYFVGDYWYTYLPSEQGDEANRIKCWILSFHLNTFNGRQRHDVTGSGNAFQVFLHAQECLKKFQEDYPEARTFVFTSDDRELSRMSLYDRMVKYIERMSWKLTNAFIMDGFKTYIYEKR